MDAGQLGEELGESSLEHALLLVQALAFAGHQRCKRRLGFDRALGARIRSQRKQRGQQENEPSHVPNVKRAPMRGEPNEGKRMRRT